MASSPQSNTAAYTALGVGILVLGFGAIFVRWAGAPGTVTAFYRMSVGAVVLTWPFARRTARAWRTGALSRRALHFAVAAGAFFAFDVALWASGVMLSGPNTPTLLANTAPVWVGLGALVFLHERLRIGFWLGLALALVGAAIILRVDAQQSSAVGLGSLLGLVAALFYAGYFLVTQIARRAMDALSILWVASVTASIILLSINLVLRRPLLGYALPAYASMFALGLLSQAIGWLAINHALGILPASVVAPTMLGQPVMTVLLAIPLLGETLSPGQFAGACLVLVGVYIVHRNRARGAPRTPVQP